MSSELSYSFDPAADVRTLLSPGENLLWSGSPKKGIVLRRSDAALIPFSLFWCGFVFFWEYMAIQSKFLPMIIFGGIFVIAGFIFAIGRFFIDASRRAGTTYGVTDSRIIIDRKSVV